MTIGGICCVCVCLHSRFGVASNFAECRHEENLFFTINQGILLASMSPLALGIGW